MVVKNDRCHFCTALLGRTYLVHDKENFCKPDCLDNYVIREMLADFQEYDRDLNWQSYVPDPTEGTIQ